MADSHSQIGPDNGNAFDNETKPINYEVLGKINVHAIWAVS
jgi:hypothetical protein